MLEYYKKELEIAEMKVTLAKDGYEKKINDLSAALKGASIEKAEQLIDEIKVAKKAVSELEADSVYAKERYQKEFEKPENTQKRAKEILYGETNEV